MMPIKIDLKLFLEWITKSKQRGFYFVFSDNPKMVYLAIYYERKLV